MLPVVGLFSPEPETLNLEPIGQVKAPELAASAGPLLHAASIREYC
jgi:hypothetical protein